MSTSTKLQIAKPFRELWNPKWRIFAIYGGRGSLKSHTVARRLLLEGRKRKIRVLCTRELQKSIKDSVHKLLSDLINDLEFNEYEVKQDTIINTKTGAEFIFTGIRNNTNEIKSMEGIDYCWCEEAQSLTDASIKVLTPTIRKPGSQIIFTFNRLEELDPVYVKYVKNAGPKTCVINVNYDVALKLGWLPDVLIDEMEEDKKDPEVFAHKWLGEPISQQENSIINRGKILEAMERTVPDDGQTIVGVDVARKGKDRTVLWKRKGMKTIDHKIYKKLKTTEVCDKIEQFVDFNTSTEIKVDDTGVGGGVTDELDSRGYFVVPINFGSKANDVDKYPNWISEAWFYMQEHMDEIELPMDSDLIMELSTRTWSQDAKGKRKVESKEEYKKRGFSSPDLADACIICYASPNQLTTDDFIM